MDPSVTDEHDPVGTDSDLDMYDDRHGPPYKVDFIARYRAARSSGTAGSARGATASSVAWPRTD